MSTSTTASAQPAPLEGGSFFGHPRGLSTLFFTEMWERFSYYGMRALLILYMTASTMGVNPGMGYDVGTAAAIYGLYTGFVYLLSLPGGWVADNLWGQRKAVWVGGWIIASGHFSMAIPSTFTFFLGLCLIVTGTGLLKPNVSTMVADLYPESGARRDAGFSVFYMGINLGALMGPFFCSLLGEGYNWHLGFSLAGFGMVLGLVQYKLGAKYLGDAGELKVQTGQAERSALARRFYLSFFGAVAAAVLFGVLVAQGIIPIGIQTVAQSLGGGILIVVFLYFGYLWLFGGHTREENLRLAVILWLFVLSAVFWSGFEQAGSSLNLFARDLTDRSFDFAGGWEMPASLLQSVNSFFIIVLAPVFGWIWVWLARRDASPSMGAKFGLGLLGLSVGFFVLAWGAANASPTSPVSPAWLIVTYFFHTVGELALSPVGLSSVTKLAPKGRVGQMMGIWFVATALGNVFAGLVAGTLETMAPFSLFRTVAMIVGGVGLVALLVSPFVKKVTAPVEGPQGN